MHNSNPHSDVAPKSKLRILGKIVLRIVMILCFVILLEEAVRFVYLPSAKYSIFANREYKAAQGTVDTLFCGTSHVYYAFDPELFDNRMGTTSFNMGTGAQLMSGTYFLIKEGVDINPIKNVYLGISFSSLLRSENDSARLGTFDRLTTLRGKLRYIASEDNNNRRMNELFYSTRVKNYFKIRSIKKNVSRKLKPDYKTTTPVAKENIYMYRGYQSSDAVFSGVRKTKTNKEYNVWDEANVSEESLIYLKKIIKLCKDKNINLTLVILPSTDAFLQEAGDYEGMHDYYQALTDEYNIPLYDFINYEDRLEDFPNEYFKDNNHLNLTGSRIFGNMFIDMLEQGIKNPDDF